MSCGQKAWAEELEDAHNAKVLDKFRGISTSRVISVIENAVDELERLIGSDPSLTRVQWARLDNTLKTLKELV